MQRPHHHRLALLSKLSLSLLGAASFLASTASAAPKLRDQMDLKGNFVLIGATLAQECASGLPNPVAGVIGACPDDNLAAPDIYWRADDPSAGMARADANITSADSRATSMLVLPDGAEVAYARLYWGGLQPSDTKDTSVQLQRVDGMVDMAVTADDSVSLAQSGTNAFFYQATADVTDIVKMLGVGAYRVAGVASTLDNAPLGAVAAWYMVVFYEKSTEPSRNLAIFDSLEYVDSSTQSSVMLTGFIVPPAAFDATLGVVAYEGEEQFTGDHLSFNGTDLSNTLNPADNFFNATRSFKGMPVSNEGDLPRLSGQPGSYSNVDLDVIDVTARVKGGDTSATIAASSDLDIFVLSAFVTSISTLLPDFTPTIKKVVDVNGGVAAPGDVLEFQIIAENDGSDASVGTILRDPLPMGVTFVPGSINVFAGANMGMKTDAAADDQAEYDATTRTVIARLGMGATAMAGGKLAIAETTEVRFQVTIDAATRGDISNQGTITASGEQGAAEAETPTDADATVDGREPTTIFVEECEDDTQCMEPTPHCDPARMPRECVGCATSAQCDDPDFPDCDSATGTCVCDMGAGNCNDSDMDHLSDGKEDELGTDPMDADTDDDGVIDGSELGPEKDTDGDGVINALDSDSDNDGLPDGLELGLACDHADTDRARMRCTPDGDKGATKTDPLLKDTDGGGVSDGSEDFDLDGVIDTGETDPTASHGADDTMVVDTDKDGLGDELEDNLHSDPMDADTDDDGLSDGLEPNPTLDDDQDGAISVLDVDSDNDALFDGTETGYACDGGATDASKGHCRGDADLGMTQTSPLDPDTDHGGVRDGSEDINLNGVVDGGELNPVKGQGADDANSNDTDMDGLSDALEDALHTNKNDADTDDDGLRDGDEANPSDDHDGDGQINALDPDSDDDGLFDGTELGKDCGDPATDGAKATCLADKDPATKTSPILIDTDFGGIADGKEDNSHDGAIDNLETNPKDGTDDAECEIDSDCGGTDSGLICIDGACQGGCRGADGNGCPTGEFCSSVDGMAGVCAKLESDIFGGGGCECGVSAVREEDLPTLLLVIGALLVPAWRRRQRG
jgi:uncharacterized repeat protein (TIGR01451 family)